MPKKESIVNAVIVVFLCIGFVVSIVVFVGKSKGGPSDNPRHEISEANQPAHENEILPTDEPEPEEAAEPEPSPPASEQAGIPTEEENPTKEAPQELSLPDDEPEEPEPDAIPIEKEPEPEPVDDIPAAKPDPVLQEFDADAGTSWQIQLDGEIDTSYDVELYDIDIDAPQAIIDELHDKGIWVACYFSAGSREEWRNDASQFPEESLGKTLSGWPGERWLDVADHEKFADIMLTRMDRAKAKGCEAIDPDNVDGYANITGYSISYEQQLAYNNWLAEEAHKRGLAIGLRNDLSQVRYLADHFDFAVNEQCMEYHKCDLLWPFIRKDKAVFHIEYNLKEEEFCEESLNLDFSSLKMDKALDGGRISCEDY